MPVAGRYEHCGLTDEEGRQLQRIVRRANTARSGGRAYIMASASGASVSAIARLLGAAVSCAGDPPVHPDRAGLP